MSPVNEHGPERQLPHNLIQGPLRHQKFFKAVAQAVEGCAEEREEVALDLVRGREGVVPCDFVGAEEDAYAADGEEDAEDLRPVVAHAQEEEGDYYYDYYGPEVYELGGEDGRLFRGKELGVANGEVEGLKTYVSVRQHDEVVSFHVEEGEDDEAPSVFEDELAPFLETVLVDGVARVDKVEQDIVEEGLESRDTSPFEGEELRQRICRRDTNRKD